MKKIILFLLSIISIITLFSVNFAGSFEKSGEYFRYFEDNGSVAYDKIIEADRKKYYVNNDGYAVFNSWVEKDGKYYYAGSDGAFKTDGVYEIEGYKYYLNIEGEMQKGWCCDYLYYGDEEDGYLINGFQELDVPKDFTTELENEKTAWFYFDTTTCKRVYSEDDPYIVKTIGNENPKQYCFDQNGILRTGWRFIKEKNPPMKGYMYFVEESTDDFKYGEAVTGTWYAVEPPVDVIPSSEVRYFYFNELGNPRCAPVGKLQKVRFDNKTFLFNEYGYAVYGVHQIDNDFYYFGPSVLDCSMKTGLINTDVDGSGDGSTYYFQDDGKGYTGVHNNKLYYKGKLQKAEPEQKYAAFQINNTVRLVNSQGTIMKSKNHIKDGDGCEWSTNSGGTVTYMEDGAIAEMPKAPELSGDN